MSDQDTGGTSAPSSETSGTDAGQRLGGPLRPPGYQAVPPRRPADPAQDEPDVRPEREPDVSPPRIDTDPVDPHSVLLWIGAPLGLVAAAATLVVVPSRAAAWLMGGTLLLITLYVAHRALRGRRLGSLGGLGGRGLRRPGSLLGGLGRPSGRRSPLSGLGSRLGAGLSRRFPRASAAGKRWAGRTRDAAGRVRAHLPQGLGGTRTSGRTERGTSGRPGGPSGWWGRMRRTSGRTPKSTTGRPGGRPGTSGAGAGRPGGTSKSGPGRPGDGGGRPGLLGGLGRGIRHGGRTLTDTLGITKPERPGRKKPAGDVPLATDQDQAADPDVPQDEQDVDPDGDERWRGLPWWQRGWYGLLDRTGISDPNSWRGIRDLYSSGPAEDYDTGPFEEPDDGALGRLIEQEIDDQEGPLYYRVTRDRPAAPPKPPPAPKPAVTGAAPGISVDLTPSRLRGRAPGTGMDLTSPHSSSHRSDLPKPGRQDSTTREESAMSADVTKVNSGPQATDYAAFIDQSAPGTRGEKLRAAANAARADALKTDEKAKELRSQARKIEHIKALRDDHEALVQEAAKTEADAGTRRVIAAQFSVHADEEFADASA